MKRIANTEFYFAPPEQIDNKNICLTDEEAKHLALVMRHKIGDSINITDGKGKIYESRIKLISKSSVVLEISNKYELPAKFSNVTIFIPLLKSSDRMETALEKCVELGFTNFVVFSAEKSPKKGIKINRLEKIGLSAMKQSLQANRPKITNQELDVSITQNNVQNIVLDQLAEQSIFELTKKNVLNDSINLIFGPEAGLTEKDLSKIFNPVKIYLTPNRLRAETAIISAASIIAVIRS